MSTTDIPTSPTSPLISSPTDSIDLSDISFTQQYTRIPSLLPQLNTDFETRPQEWGEDSDWDTETLVNSADSSTSFVWYMNEDGGWDIELCRRYGRGRVESTSSQWSVDLDVMSTTAVYRSQNDEFRDDLKTLIGSPIDPMLIDGSDRIQSPADFHRSRQSDVLPETINAQQYSPSKATNCKQQKYHLIVELSNDQSCEARFFRVLNHLRNPLVPLVSVRTGIPHPEFPRSLLQYHLLTHEQLDSLARWYHQVNPPVEETWRYPAWIPAWTSLTFDDGNINDTNVIDLETKRRRWGRFIGLRGCESPIDGIDCVQEDKKDDVAADMERQWRNALRRAQEEQSLRDKSWNGRL